jgi:hypothetical protein
MDRSIRQTLRNPANLRDFLRSALPQFADRFDCDRAHLLEREFLTEDWRGREADLPFEVPYRTDDGERTALVCLLLEHQSDTDPLIPLRFLYIAVMYWSDQRREWEALPPPRPPLQLRPVVPLVLYTGAVPWGSNRVLTDLMGEPRELHVFAPRCEPLFWNLAEHSAAELLGSGGAWLQALAVLRAQAEDPAVFQQVFREVMQQLTPLQEQQHIRWEELIRFVLTHALRRRSGQERTTLRGIAAEVYQQRRPEEVTNMGKTIADELIEEGQLLRAHRILQALLRDRFGNLPDEVARRIEAVTDLDKLQSACIQVRHLSRLEDLQL